MNNKINLQQFIYTNKKYKYFHNIKLFNNLVK